MMDYQISNRRACAVVLLGRSTWHYKARHRDDSILRKRIREIAQTRVRYGGQRIFTLLRREGCGRRAGAIIISVYTAYIAWKGLICVVSVHDGTGQRLIDWIDLNSLLFISAGAWTLCGRRAGRPVV